MKTLPSGNDSGRPSAFGPTASKRSLGAWYAGGAIGFVVVLALALVIAGLSAATRDNSANRPINPNSPLTSTGPSYAPSTNPSLGSSTSSSSMSSGPNASLAQVISEVQSVPASVANAVGTGGAEVVPPKMEPGNPPLSIGGLPGAVFVGGEFCPYCAAERWSLVLAFSRFGTWNDLLLMKSSGSDVYPDTNTFTFRQATYTSRYVAFDFSEHWDINRNTLNPLNSVEQSAYGTYGIADSVPFVDIGNKFIMTSPSFSPQVLAGLSWQQIAAKLPNPSDPVTLAIVGAANYLTAGLCNVDGNVPSTVCTEPGVAQAALAMKL